MRSLPLLPHSAEPQPGLTQALLHEIQTALRNYDGSADPHIIDLRSLPLSPADRETLDAFLGKGEVQATLNLFGPSEVWETRFCGVWRLVHRDAQQAVVADTIEITSVPAVLCAPREDIALAAERLGQATALGQVDGSYGKGKGQRSEPEPESRS